MILRPHIIHVMPNIQLDGSLGMLMMLASELQSKYAHTVLTEGGFERIPVEVMHAVQSAGINLLAVDVITQDDLQAIPATGVILYNVTGHPGIGKVYPTIYYSYGVYDSAPGETMIVACSEFAREFNHSGAAHNMAAVVIPPAIQSRALRQLRPTKTRFRVGILSSGAYDKYPCDTVIKLCSLLPDSIEILATALPAYRHPGVTLAMADRAGRKALRPCPVKPMASIRYALACDVVVCASSSAYHEPFGRMAVEAMALRKPVLCERRGNYPNLIEHGVNGLLYDAVDELVENILRLQKDTEIASQLGINAQMSAGWYDTSVHIGDVKHLFRRLGI